MVANVSVVIPTIGRPGLLRDALASLARCDPPPAEILIIDQSDDLVSRGVVEELNLPTAKVVPCPGRGIGRAHNHGLRIAKHPIVLIVHDDCTVRSDWIAVAQRAMAEVPGGIITGRVLPGGDDPRAVPSTCTVEEPRDYTGEFRPGALFPNNMACSREEVLAIGGFDELIVPAAEDCDLSYRWLRAGRSLRHVPDLVVWHHDWRTPEELERLYVNYYRGSGMFYAKHLFAGDLVVLHFLAHDYYGWLCSLFDAWRSGVPRWADYRRGAFRGLPQGLWAGWRHFGPPRRDSRPRHSSSG